MSRDIKFPPISHEFSDILYEATCYLLQDVSINYLSYLCECINAQSGKEDYQIAMKTTLTKLIESCIHPYITIRSAVLTEFNDFVSISSSHHMVIVQNWRFDFANILIEYIKDLESTCVTYEKVIIEINSLIDYPRRVITP
jgi:hypothetical protein